MSTGVSGLIVAAVVVTAALASVARQFGWLPEPRTARYWRDKASDAEAAFGDVQSELDDVRRENADLRVARIEPLIELVRDVSETVRQVAETNEKVFDRIAKHNGSFAHIEESLASVKRGLASVNASLELHADGMQALTGVIAELHDLPLKQPRQQQPAA